LVKLLALAPDHHLHGEKARDAGSIHVRTLKLHKTGSTTALATTFTYDVTTKRAVLNSSANLQSGAIYKAVISAGMRDLARNALDPEPESCGQPAEGVVLHGEELEIEKQVWSTFGGPERRSPGPSFRCVQAAPEHASQDTYLIMGSRKTACTGLGGWKRKSYENYGSFAQEG